MKWFQKKRMEAAGALPPRSLLILSAAPETLRQPDVSHPYRQDSNFYYLTGFQDPGALLALSPSGRSVLLIPDKDPKKELWSGPMLSPAAAKKRFLMDEAHPVSELDQRLGRMFKGPGRSAGSGPRRVFYNRGRHPFFDRKLRKFAGSFLSAEEFLAPLRRIKDAWELSHLKKAAAATAYGHRAIARALRPGINERALHGVFLKSIMERGAPREGYSSIIASGGRAATLHYTKNSFPCRRGELLLVDAGAEMAFYTADVSRVYPVGGRFSPPQKNLCRLLLALQKRLIQEVRPGASMKALNKKMREGLGEILLKAGLLLPEAAKKKALLRAAAKAFCPHSMGHLLGLDVHDAGFNRNKEDLILAPGMALTVEPGIYIPSEGPRLSAPASKSSRGGRPSAAEKELGGFLNMRAIRPLLGCGLRIEDNIFVTARGRQNLTQSIPKEIEDIEALCQSGRE